TGAFSNNGGALDLDTNGGDGGGTVTVGGTLGNAGKVQLGSAGNNLAAATTLTLGGLTNASGASFEVFGSASHPATLAFSSGGTGFTSNAGFVDLSDTAPLTLASAFDNSGTVVLGETAALTVTGDFTNSGATELDAAQLDGGGSLTIGGVLANTGDVLIGNTALSAATTLTLGGLTNNYSGASLQLFGSPSQPVTLAFSTGGAGFTLNAGTFMLSIAA